MNGETLFGLVLAAVAVGWYLALQTVLVYVRWRQQTAAPATSPFPP
jgi:hypothetical protein